MSVASSRPEIALALEHASELLTLAAGAPMLATPPSRWGHRSANSAQESAPDTRRSWSSSFESVATKSTHGARMRTDSGTWSSEALTSSGGTARPSFELAARSATRSSPLTYIMP